MEEHTSLDFLFALYTKQLSQLEGPVGRVPQELRMTHGKIAKEINKFVFVPERMDSLNLIFDDTCMSWTYSRTALFVHLRNWTLVRKGSFHGKWTISWTLQLVITYRLTVAVYTEDQWLCTTLVIINQFFPKTLLTAIPSPCYRVGGFIIYPSRWI